MRFVSYFPLLAVAFEIPWSVLMFAALIFAVGDTPYTNTPGKERAFGIIGTLPVAAGLIIGIIAFTMRWPTRQVEWICLALGTLSCAALLWGGVVGW